MTVNKDFIELPKSVLATLSLEIWRLSSTIKKMKNQPNTVALRYSTRKIIQELESHGISYIDLEGETYDAGMAVNIVDNKDIDLEMTQNLIIKEMVSPVILLNGKFLTHGQVILEKKVINVNLIGKDKR